MSFFQRIMHHWVNEILVEKLANSRAFQRFAIRTNAMFEEMKTKGAEGTLEKGSEVAQTTLSQALNFFQSFKNELSGAARK